MIDLQADEELKDSIVVAMPNLVGEGYNMYTIRVYYEWKPLRCLSYKVFGHVLNECPKKIFLDVVKNLNNPRQATKEKQAEVSRQEVSNSNPFNALNSIENDDELGMNRGNTKSARKGSLNVAHGSSSNTHIIDKIKKLERKIIDSKLMFVDDDGIPLVPVGNVDNESEVEVGFDETSNLMSSTSFKSKSDKETSLMELMERYKKCLGLVRLRVIRYGLGSSKRYRVKKGYLDVNIPLSHKSIWIDIIRDISSTKNKDIDLMAFVRKKMGEFSVKSVQNYTDDIFLPKEPVQTRWVKVVLIKVNIMSWRVWLDNLPTRFNLSSRGLEIPSLPCPLCNVSVESTSHNLFSCPLARQLWNKVLR
nr:RNA-directed DNA polymerase, eukaryota [Tanacetum cinerariifolium]